MNERTGDGDWNVTLRPRLTPLLARVAAAVIAGGGILVAIFNNRASGAYLRPADQFAMAGIALVLSAGVLLLTRPRLKVGPHGLAVRNLVDYRLIPWDEVVDVSFPPGKRWARVDLDNDEYVPVMAIQVLDKQGAVAAMDSVRALMDRYHRG